MKSLEELNGMETAKAVFFLSRLFSYTGASTRNIIPHLEPKVNSFCEKKMHKPTAPDLYILTKTFFEKTLDKPVRKVYNKYRKLRKEVITNDDLQNNNFYRGQLS